MSGETVRVVARITALPGKASELAPILRGLIAPTRREAGCISYHFFVNSADPCDFVFVEEWASHSAIDTHLATSHVHETLAKAGSMLAKVPEISRYAVIE